MHQSSKRAMKRSAGLREGQKMMSMGSVIQNKNCNWAHGVKLKLPSIQRKIRRLQLQLKASWEELAGVLVLSAIPFTAVKAIANSPLGESLQRRLLQQKSAAVEDSIERNNLAVKARERSPWYGRDRPRWLGPIPFRYPSYLTGDLPGDYGFDLAGLAKDPVTLLKYYNFEILHARWAMLGALGALIPEILDLTGASHFVQPVWWKVGYSKLQASICSLY